MVEIKARKMMTLFILSLKNWFHPMALTIRIDNHETAYLEIPEIFSEG